MHDNSALIANALLRPLHDRLTKQERSDFCCCGLVLSCALCLEIGLVLDWDFLR